MRQDKETTRNFFARKGVEVRDYPKRTGGKAVDFILFLDDKVWAYAEVKTIVEYDFFGERGDPTYNKIQNKIHEASKQFATSNPGHEYPNIIVFINHTPRIGFQDLWLVMTGQYSPPGRDSEVMDLRYLKRLVTKNDLNDIDFFVWIDHSMKKMCYAINSDSAFGQRLRCHISSKAHEDWDDL